MGCETLRLEVFVDGSSNERSTPRPAPFCARDLVQHHDQVDKWTTGEWLGLIAIIVTILLGVAAIVATRKSGKRRGRVRFSSTSTPLLTTGSPSSDLAVTHKNRPVENPHLVRFFLENVGPHDITREQFDEGRLNVELKNGTLYGIVSVLSSDGISPQVTATGLASHADISIQPTLLPKGITWVVEAIVSGPGEPAIRGRLINTDIVVGETTTLGFLQAMSESSATIFGTVFTLLGIPFSGRRNS
jgi:hypothetical protein